MLPTYLSHYYDCTHPPFHSLSALLPDEAEAVLAAIRQRGTSFASQRKEDYLMIRRELEATVRQRFLDKGGQPQRASPHYMIVGSCDWLKSWYAQGCELHVALDRFDPLRVSFTYGDSFPAMRYEDCKPYRKQVYTMAELPELVRCYGLPQVWNAGGAHGPDRYIEAQVWSDEPLRQWLG